MNIDEFVFKGSVQEIINRLDYSNYPKNVFNYSDNVVQEFHLRIPPSGLIEMAMCNNNRYQALLEAPVSNKNIICIENIYIAERYQGKGYFSLLIKALRKHFPKRHICVTNVRNQRMSQWFIRQVDWVGAGYFVPRILSNDDDFMRKLITQNFVLLVRRDVTFE